MGTSSTKQVIDAIDSKFNAIIQALDDKIKHLQEDMKESIKTHSESDASNFKTLSEVDEALRLAMKDLTISVGELTKQVTTLVAESKANQKTFITWPWYIGTTITILTILGGLMGGIYSQLGSLSDRIKDIEFVANISQ